MIALLWLLLAILALPFKSKCRLEAENAALRPGLRARVVEKQCMWSLPYPKQKLFKVS